MSSSLLLGSYTAQSQQQATHSQSTSSSMAPPPPSTFNFFEQNGIFIEDTKYPPANSAPFKTTKLKKCSCCPYGYHIDLDFIRYCEDLAANTQRPSNEQLERRNKRRQRKSLEAMLGFNDQWIANYEQQLRHQKQQQKYVPVVYEVSGLEDYQFRADDLVDNAFNVSMGRGDNGQNQSRSASIDNNQDEKNAFVKNILFDVCSDFERTLERASTRTAEPIKYNGSCIKKSSDTSVDDRYTDFDDAYLPRTIHTSTPKIHVVDKQQHISIKTHQEKVVTKSEITRIDAGQISIHQNDEASKQINETRAAPDKFPELLSNTISNDQLRNIRGQLIDNLNRMRELEEHIKLIPKLQLELSVEKAENRDLHLKLKELDSIIAKNEQEKKAASLPLTANLLEKGQSATNAVESSSSLTLKPFSPQRVCAMSLESLNLRFPNSTSPTNSLQSNASVPSQNKLHLKRDIGCMTQMPLLRDIGIVTTANKISTQTVAVNTDAIPDPVLKETRKTPVLLSVGIQCDAEVKKRTRNVATITDRPVSPPPQPPKPPSPPPIVKHSVGVLAIPSVRTSYCMARPEVKTVGVGNIYEKIRTRSFGTDPIKILDEQSLTQTKPSESLISLKLLDMPLLALQQSSSSATAFNELMVKPKENQSVAVQHSPVLLNKFSQCVRAPSPPPPVKIAMQTESTDTCDLILFIHRSANTDAPAPTRDHPTNTERIVTVDESTNTLLPSKRTIDTGTNPDLNIAEAQTRSIDENSAFTSTETEHKCHNCLAKIEIKQQTIIKNTNKISAAAGFAESLDEDAMNQLQQIDAQSRIPRPTALISPRPDRKFTRQNTYTVPTPSPPLPSPIASRVGAAATQCPAEAYLCKLTSVKTASRSNDNQTTNQRVESTSSERLSTEANAPGTATTLGDGLTSYNVVTRSDKTQAIDHDEPPKLWSHSMKSSSTYSQLASSSKPRQKVYPSKEMQAALKVINDSLLKNQHMATTLKNANKIIQKEWFRVSSTETAQPLEVEDYLDCFEEYSPNLLKYVVNLTDANGNTAMHYAVSHGNFDVVSILLDSKVCCINNTNNAGYTCVMLVSLAKLDIAEHQTVVQRLFQMADVNVRAKKHSQTALMLATSHGNFDMVRMLLEAGADINIQDEDGSTALMCAAEHGRMDIIKILLAQPDCDSTIQDLDGSSALKISLEAGYRDIGVLLYAHEYMTKNKSPYTSLRRSGRSRKHSSSLSSSTNVLASGSGSVSAVANVNTGSLGNVGALDDNGTEANMENNNSTSSKNPSKTTDS